MINIFLKKKIFKIQKYEKLIRNEFLAKHNLEIEAEHIKNVISLLLPKFIKDQIDHGLKFLK